MGTKVQELEAALATARAEEAQSLATARDFETTGSQLIGDVQHFNIVGVINDVAKLRADYAALAADVQAITSKLSGN